MRGTGDKLILWGVGTKRTLRAHWALHELDLPYECRPIMSRFDLLNVVGNTCAPGIGRKHP